MENVSEDPIMEVEEDVDPEEMGLADPRLDQVTDLKIIGSLTGAPDPVDPVDRMLGYLHDCCHHSSLKDTEFCLIFL